MLTSYCTRPTYHGGRPPRLEATVNFPLSKVDFLEHFVIATEGWLEGMCPSLFSSSSLPVTLSVSQYLHCFLSHKTQAIGWIWLTLIQCGLILTKSIPKALFPIGSQSEVLGRHEFWATFHPTTALRWEERFSQDHRVRGGVGRKLRPVLFQCGLLPPLTASQLSPFVQLNQSFITFKLLGTSILTAFQGPGL